MEALSPASSKHGQRKPSAFDVCVVTDGSPAKTALLMGWSRELSGDADGRDPAACSIVFLGLL